MSFLADIQKMDASAAVHPELMPGVESVTYLKRDSGASRAIYAFVRRGIVEPVAGGSGASVMKATVQVRNDATYGISSTELDNGDLIQLDLLLDGRLVRKSINTATMKITAGFLRFELL